MPLGEPGPVTPLSRPGPLFFLQEPVDWFGWEPLRVIMVTFQGSLTAPFSFTMHLPHNHLLPMG